MVFGGDGFLVAEERDGAIDQIDTQMVVLGMIGFDAVVVAGEFRKIVIGFARKEAVEAIEPSLKRPLVIGACGRGLVHWGEMPFPPPRPYSNRRGRRTSGSVAASGTNRPREPGKPQVPVGQGANPDAVMVSAVRGRLECGAQAGGMKARITEAGPPIGPGEALRFRTRSNRSR